MRNAETVVAIHRDRGSRGLPLERVYKHLLNPELFLAAYGKIYRNFGAMTKGSTEETVDGMSLQKIHGIIDLLRQERYQWTPVRRVEIPKPNGKMRPLGIPTWGDKLVQEVLRTLLEPYYEQRFSDHSHGFRPNRGCHTALREIRRTWKGTVWFIEGDIKGCFDNIDHRVLLEIIRRDIHDGRVVRLIEGLLGAGYMEDWRYHDTFSGAPQGGIVSPLLANVYLTDLDRYVEDTLIPAYTVGNRRRPDRNYLKLERQIAAAKRRGEVEEVHRLAQERRLVPSVDGFDPEYRRLRYIRYADDFLLVVGHY
jgi:group II intron reverse transcriptase/maturase